MPPWLELDVRNLVARLLIAGLSHWGGKGVPNKAANSVWLGENMSTIRAASKDASRWSGLQADGLGSQIMRGWEVHPAARRRFRSSVTSCLKSEGLARKWKIEEFKRGVDLRWNGSILRIGVRYLNCFAVLSRCFSLNLLRAGKLTFPTVKVLVPIFDQRPRTWTARFFGIYQRSAPTLQRGPG